MYQSIYVYDGTGDGNAAKVNSSHQLLTRATQISAIHEAALRGDAYSWTAVTADINAGDTALCVVNQSKTKNLVISYMYAYGDVPTQIKVHVPAACTWAGTAVVGVNLNREYASILAEAVAYADETGTTFAAANTIITLITNELTSDQFGISHDFKDSVILGYDDAIAADLIAETAAFECTFVGYFVDK